MNDLLLILLKVSLGIGVIILPYYVLLRKDRNLGIKRAYLVTGLLAAWLVPFLPLRPAEEVAGFPVLVEVGEIAVRPEAMEQGLTGGQGFSLLNILLMVYLAGILFFLLRSLISVSVWEGVWKHSTDRKNNIAYTANGRVFSFLNRVFIPVEMKNDRHLENILIHEQAHVQQFHYLDLLLAEFSLILTWFNPFSWLILGMIKENHEHLADREVLLSGVDPALYKTQILNNSVGFPVFRLGNAFNQSFTKKRFEMMKHFAHSGKGILKYFFLVPFVFCLLGFFSGTAAQKPGKTVQGKVVFADSGEPVSGATVVVKSQTLGTVTDDKGIFILELEGDPELEILFPGCLKQSLFASKIGKKPIKLAKDPDWEESEKNMETKVVSSEITVVVEDDGAPENTLKGRVISGETGEPVMGATVTIAGQNTGTITDNNGEFVITHKGDPMVLVKSPSSKSNVVIRASDISNEPIRIQAVSSGAMIGEISKQPLYIVNGKVMKDVSGIDPEIIQSVEVVKIPQDVMEGDIENGVVVIILKDGKQKVDLSGETKLEIRLSENTPVYVVDGEVMEDISGIDPDRIKSMEVIKDKNHELAKKYQAENGVVVITLKDGKQKVDLSGETKLEIRMSENTPVYVVDGEVMEDISGIDPDRIKSMEVIKDKNHELAKKYQAENGLILIHLKK